MTFLTLLSPLRLLVLLVLWQTVLSRSDTAIRARDGSQPTRNRFSSQCCNYAGIVNPSVGCAGPCMCKAGVTGRYCDECKPGYYNLDFANSEGCSQCFCFGATNRCSSTSWGKNVTRNTDGWLVSDIEGQRNIEPDVYDDGHLAIANDEMHVENYYWDAPHEYLGSKLYSYGGDLKFNIGYIVARGDTSGIYTQDADVILQGGPKNVRIGYNWKKPTKDEGGRTVISVPLREQGWFKIAEGGKRGRKTVPVSREEFALITNNLKRMLIRAKFHTDQVEGSLYQVDMEQASEKADPGQPMVGTEQCECPPGYAGLSCELCAPGYRRVNNTLMNGKCEKCDCNGHAPSCDPYTGKCALCLHHTTGPKCEKCQFGYYGDPSKGTPDDCKPCACPLPVESNNFSPTCELSSSAIGGYKCTDCPLGYTGDRCDRCADGFYGNPNVPGGRCIPCDCGPGVNTSIPGWCDHLTGMCAKCKGTINDDCKTCPPKHVLTHTGCMLCEDKCVDMLVDDVEYFGRIIMEANLTGIKDLARIRLNYMLTIVNTTRHNLWQYQALINGGQRVMQNVTFNFDLETLADILYLKAKDMESKGAMINSRAFQLGNEAEELLDFIGDLLEEINKVIDILRRYGLDTKGPGFVATDRMLHEAERILRELQLKNFMPQLDGSDRELRKANYLLERVKHLISSPQMTSDLEARLEKLRILLSDVINLVQGKVQQPVATSLRLVQEGKDLYIYVVSSLENSTSLARSANGSLTEARRLLEIAKTGLIEAAVQFGLVPRIKDELDNATVQIEHRRNILARLNPEYTDKYVKPCVSHIEDLRRRLDYLIGLFNATKEVSQYPMQAATVYQKIVDALTDAEASARTAFEAAEKAYAEAYPGTDESLVRQAQLAKDRSYQLLAEAKALRDKAVPDLERDLAKKRYLLDMIFEDMSNSERNLDLINKALDGLPRNLARALKETDMYLRTILEGLTDIHSSIDFIDQRLHDELLPTLDRLRAGTASGLDNITKIIEKARSDIRAASRTASNTEEINERNIRIHSQLSLNLKDLKDRILLARQKASSIKVSLGADENGVCVRSFKADVEPSTTNSIVLNYATKDEARDGLLFFIASSTTDDFMAIEMVSRKIRFLWNAGGGTQIIEHDLNIETNDPWLLKDNQWYKIHVNRIGNVASLTVKRTPDGEQVDANEVTGSSPPNFMKMDIDSTSYLYIGGLPADFRAPRELRTRKFSGCLYELSLDGKQIGLWNFKTNQGCHGCKEGASEPKDPGIFQFKGDQSYAILSQIQRYDKRKYLVSLQFKTFDEDALLFFAPNTVTGDYVSLTLREGHVVYQFNLATSARLTLTSKLKYNSGQWVRLAAERDRFEGVLSVEDELIEGKVPTGGPTSLELADIDLYYGGVPTNFSVQPWDTMTFKPFLGCMKDLQIDTTPLGLSSGESHGVDLGCKEREARVVTFKGTGFMELKSMSLREEADFSFTFKTTQSDALLLVSTFQGQPRARDKDSHYYTVAIVGGLLEARFNGDNGETPLISELRVNDGQYHTVSVSKRHRRISMTLDDVEIGASRLAKGTRDIEAPDEGGLFLGGLPSAMTLRGMAGTREPLKGVIRDFVLNKKPLKLNEPILFQGVSIGRQFDVFQD
ncbi:Laminin subunit alpha-2 [Halotydeus destructor]|nr:Laminin subunit alpha-2 [Halotydeus destructor]